MAGQCSGTINIVIPCTPNWQVGAWGACQPNGTQTRTVTDLNNCGDTTGKPVESQSCTYTPSYREAVLTSCFASPIPVTPGNSFLISIAVATGSVSEQYILALSGDINGRSNPFWINGTPTAIQLTIEVPFIIPSSATGGSKSFVASLVKGVGTL